MDQESSRWWDWLSACLLFFAMLVAAGRLLATNWIPHLDYVEVLVAFGVILGLALGKSQFKRRTVIWLAIGYTLVVVPWQLSHATEDAISWGERLASLGGRLIYAFAQLSSRQPVDDYILFLTFVSILFWFISIFSAYALIRHGSILGAIIPGGLAILILQTYDPAVSPRIWYLGSFLFLSLIIYGRLDFNKSSRDWKQRRIFISPEANVDISLAVLISAGVLVLLAWTMPLSLPSSPVANRFWNNLVHPWDNLKQRFNDAFAALHGTVAVGPRDFYSDNLPLGLGNPLGDEILFTVLVPRSAKDLPRLYWRGRTYDKYEDGNWSTTADTTEKFSPDNDKLVPADTVYGVPDTFYFTTYITNQSLLYLIPDLTWISRSGEYKYFPVEGNKADLVLMRTSRNLQAGETYSAKSMLFNPTILQLDTAGENYPDWVTERYLQLPRNFSPHVTSLAEDITRGKESPYDKAVAITDYLRQNIKYVEQVSAPPPNTDQLEWFLFETKQGFCNYYATAEVLMLRSVGVPARLAVGYAQGEPNDEGTTYYVLQKNAHAWVEVYFPGIGWVEFEPTASQSPIVRPEGVAHTDQSGGDLTPLTPGDANQNQPDGGHEPLDLPQPTAQRMDYLRITTWVIILLLIALIGLFYWRGLFIRTPVYQAPIVILAFLERRHLPAPRFLFQWAQWSEQTPIARSFDVINQSLRWLGKPQPVSATPAERAEALSELLPEASEEIATLTAEHQATLYSPRVGNISLARQASQTIRYKTIKRLINRFFS
jgi:transglutaminase-like putative cysteine protease